MVMWLVSHGWPSLGLSFSPYRTLAGECSLRTLTASLRGRCALSLLVREIEARGSHRGSMTVDSLRNVNFLLFYLGYPWLPQYSMKSLPWGL